MVAAAVIFKEQDIIHTGIHAHTWAHSDTHNYNAMQYQHQHFHRSSQPYSTIIGHCRAAVTVFFIFFKIPTTTV